MRNTVITAAVLFLFSVQAPAYAEQKIGYIDLQAVMTQSKAGKATRATLKKLVDRKKSSIKKDEDKLQGMQKEFEKDKMLMSKEQLQKKQEEFRTRMQSYQQKVSESEGELNKKQAELTEAMLKDVEKIIADVAKNNNFTMLVDKARGGIVFADKSLDMTAEVIKRYDASYKK